jgi:hypothetical protein
LRAAGDQGLTPWLFTLFGTGDCIAAIPTAEEVRYLRPNPALRAQIIADVYDGRLPPRRPALSASQ